MMMAFDCLFKFVNPTADLKKNSPLANLPKKTSTGLTCILM